MEKKIYSAPRLSDYGDVQKLTQQGGTGNTDIVNGVPSPSQGGNTGNFNFGSKPCTACSG